MGAPAEILALVEKYREGEQYYKSAEYKEMSLRSEFLNPVLKALGWDPNNTGLLVSQREVAQDNTLTVDGREKAPDYAFLIEGKWQWFLEAKRPSVNIETGRPPAYQIRRYCWNAGVPLGIVSDFEEWAIYDCRDEPHPTDSAAVGRLDYFTFDQLDERWEQLSSLFGRSSVGEGSLAQFAEKNPSPRGMLTVDQAFLKEIRTWRQLLAVDIARHNPAIDAVALNGAVQTLIDRIIFLRIAEARGLEEFGDLKNVADKPAAGVYVRLVGLFRRADNRYNSGLFHFNKSKGQSGAPDVLSAALSVSDRPLRHIIERLYHPHPYDFQVMPADVLGRVYEQFLGETITLTGHKAEIEVKPEFRKSGGVYYTPVPIVEYIVQETVGPLLLGLKPADVAKLRVLDPACGSGSFLIVAYQFLIDWHTSFYAQSATLTKKFLDRRADGGVRLNTSERKRILLANIYGVDIDPQAVEVTKLSLLLKVIEGQTQLEFEVGRLLPDLDLNIRCGNSLIDVDFPMPMDATEEERLQFNPFSWTDEFPSIMDKGGFDAIVGNPPYLNIDAVWGRKDPRLAYVKSAYSDIHTDKTDILFYFMAKAVKLCRGEIGFIVSRAFLEADKAKKLRGWLAAHARVREVVDFRKAIVFPRVGVNTAIVRMTGSKAVKQGVFRRYLNDSLPPGYGAAHLRDMKHFEVNKADLSSLGSAAWIVTDQGNAELLRKIDAAGDQVGSILFIGQGMQTGANASFVIPESERLLLAEAKRAGMAHRRARNSDIEAYDISDDGPWMLYVEDARSFTSLTQEIKKHLNSQRPVLSKRKAFERGNCEWWRYTWPLHKERFGTKVILCPYRARDNRFAVDLRGRYLGITDTTVLYDNEQPEDLRYITAVLNSRVLTYRFRFIGKLAGGGSYEYFENTVSKLPIPRRGPGDPEHDELVAKAQHITEQKAIVRSTKVPAEQERARREIAKALADIERRVERLFGLSREDAAMIDAELAR